MTSSRSPRARARDSVAVLLDPGFAQVAMALLDAARHGRELSEPEREGLSVLRDAISTAVVERLRQGR